MIEYPKTVKHKGIIFEADIQHRTSRRGHKFWILIYKNYFVAPQVGYVHLPDGWQDMDRTITAQDIYWVDKYDARSMQREAA